MRKNSTLKLWDLFLKDEYFNFDRSEHKLLSTTDLQPRQETINKILAYSRSVRGVKIKSNNKILISLN